MVAHRFAARLAQIENSESHGEALAVAGLLFRELPRVLADRRTLRCKLMSVGTAQDIGVQERVVRDHDHVSRVTAMAVTMVVTPIS
jgi:hypothetical protein